MKSGFQLSPLCLRFLCFACSFSFSHFFQFSDQIMLVIFTIIIFNYHMKQPFNSERLNAPASSEKQLFTNSHQIHDHSQKHEENKNRPIINQLQQKPQSNESQSIGQDNLGDDEQISQNNTAKKQRKMDKRNIKNTLKQQIKSNQETEKRQYATGQSSQVNLNGDCLLQKQQNEEITPSKIIKQKSATSQSKKKRRSNIQYDKNEEDSNIQTYLFPFTNQYIAKHSQKFLSTEDAIEKAKIQLRDPKAQGTFLNCDVRYFNWELFIQQVGKFDVLIIDPPWRIKGAQQNDSQFMFSNCKFSLQYNTMGNSQIARIPLHLVSDEGFIFLWILNSQLDTSIEILQTWGYELVDQISWVKLRDGKIYLTHGYYFMHSYQICLVGYKNKGQQSNKQQRLKIKGPFTNNTMFAEVKKKSQKPQDLYSIIQMMFPGKRRVQIFARNHNLRFGVFSIGNELGQSYEKWNLHLNCDKCQYPIEYSTKRYKSRLKPNYDLCFKCVEHENKDEFFEIYNEVDEGVRHEYVVCNHCKSEPIWGIRFQCQTCPDFDVCENCYDQNLLAEQKFHPIDHKFRFLQIPVFGNGFPIHEVKCFSCYQNPIIGTYFNCTFCKNYKMCQKCYFQRPKTDTTSRNHKPDHQMQVVIQPQSDPNKKYECFSCKVQISQNCYMCQNCFNFFFCQKCYQKRELFKSLYANNHKKYHVCTKIF